jgi:hypothetical protein
MRQFSLLEEINISIAEESGIKLIEETKVKNNTRTIIEYKEKKYTIYERDNYLIIYDLTKRISYGANNIKSFLISLTENKPVNERIQYK